jgi:hypothetical protein
MMMAVTMPLPANTKKRYQLNNRLRWPSMYLRKIVTKTQCRKGIEVYKNTMREGIDVQARVYQQQVRVETALKNTVRHDRSGREEHVVQRLIRVIKYFLTAEAVAEAEQPHAKRKRETLVEEIQDQHGHTPVVPLPVHKDEALEIPAMSPVK